MNINITPDEYKALNWCKTRLRSCYIDSQKALNQRPPTLQLTAQENVTNYFNLECIINKIETIMPYPKKY